MSDTSNTGRPLTPAARDPMRWWYLLVIGQVECILLWVGWSLVFGSRRQVQGNSLQKLHDVVPIPWPVWGTVFWLLAALLLHRRTRTFAYATTAALAGWFIVLAIGFTYLGGKSTNVITIAFSTLAPTMLMAGVRYSIEARLRPRTSGRPR